MKKFILLCALASLISGCAFYSCNLPARSSDYMLYQLGRGYNGKPVNVFFADFGFPTASYKLAQGTVYRWNSLQAAPQNAGNYYSPGGTYHESDTYRGVTERQYCELRIYTDQSDSIQRFAFAVDTVGKWSNSRCSEIFNKTYP